MGATIRVLGTGGTIAGVARPGGDDSAYDAGALAVRELLAPLLEDLRGVVDRVEPVEVAQVDSSAMTHAVWQRLASEVQRAMEDPQVRGVVITHGTDTLEETAIFLDGVVLPSKPVVMTAAMRPATSSQADGPRHLAQALRLVADARACGLLMAFGGQAWPAVAVRKVQPFDLQAFSAASCGPVAVWEAEGWRWTRTGDAGAAGVQASEAMQADAGTHAAEWPDPVDGRRTRVRLPECVEDWPVVEILSSHAGASGRAVQALLDAGAQGLVVSASGNGSVHAEIDRALQAAVAAGRLRHHHVMVASRCTGGWVVGQPAHGWPVAARCTPAQARVALMLRIAAHG